MKLELSTIIERPPAVVFDFFAVNHVQNHPRWDPHMRLEQVTPGPVGVGTRINRRNTRRAEPIGGTMDIVEFEPARSFGAKIVDQTPNGPMTIDSRATFERLGESVTRLTLLVEVPAMTVPLDSRMIENSLRRIKELVESQN